METIEFKGQTIRKWSVGNSTFLALPEKGARLMNWHIRLADGSVRDIIHWPEEADFEQIANVRGGNPILFPFTARCFDKGEIGYWRDPKKQRRPMQMHGYARDGEFELSSWNTHGFTATFLPSDAAREAYPFAYTFRVHYRFEDLALYVDLELKNEDKMPIPWSAGHHFYFTLPWHPDLERKDYRILADAKKAFHQDGAGNLVPVKDFPREAHFNDPAIVDLIRCKLRENQVRFGPLGGEEDICIRFGDTPVPHPWMTLVTWTQKDNSPFYCVEPWMGPPNCQATGQGVHWVEPGKSEVFRVSVSM